LFIGEKNPGSSAKLFLLRFGRLRHACTMAADRLLLRYTLLAARAEQLLIEPALEDVEVPDEAVQLLDDAAYRLGLYVSAMPGSRAPALADFEALAGEIDEVVGS
jgi:hypothetical protein